MIRRCMENRRLAIPENEHILIQPEFANMLADNQDLKMHGEFNREKQQVTSEY